MASSSSSTIYLVKDFTFQVPTVDWARVKAKDINIIRDNPEFRGDSSYVDAIVEYLDFLAALDRKLICLLTEDGLSLEQERKRTFYAFLSMKVIENLCRILPSPFIQIECRVMYVSQDQQESTVKMCSSRLDLSGILEQTQFPEYQLLFEAQKGSIPMCPTVTCDIKMGWVAPSGSKPLKISMSSFMGNLYGRESTKDLTMIAGNGAEIKCHRVIIEAHSDVIAAMLCPQNGMIESTTGTIQMRENSEEGLSRLVRYLYGMDLTTEDLSCDVAVELFKTAHRYKLEELHTSLVEMLLERKEDWFSADDLLEIYFHIKDSGELVRLVSHLLQMMLRLSHNIRSCERFEELKRTDGTAAYELLWKLLDLEQKNNRTTSAPKRRRHT